MKKKIKYQGGITKFIAGKIANNKKNDFINKLHSGAITPIINKLHQDASEFKLEICSFSSNKDFADQVLSIMSCIKYLGIPKLWTVYSDGTHTNEQITFLHSNFPFLKLAKIEWHDYTELPDVKDQRLIPYAEEILHYAKEKPLGKRLYYYLNHPIVVPTLFIDADILFYSKARQAFDLMIKENKSGWFLPDAVWGCLDSRYKALNHEQIYQINGGCFLFSRPLETTGIGLDFLRSLNFEYEYFSDQNVFHIQLREANFIPMDPRIFVLDSEDQFDFSTKYHPSEIALRHYTNPVRHKMWQNGWDWHFKA